MACIVTARALDIGVPYFGALPENSPTRLGGPFGNSSYLSIYMLVNLVLASGFAARAWATVAPPGDPGERRAGPKLLQCINPPMSHKEKWGCFEHGFDER